MILKLTCGRFELRKSGEQTEYYIDGEEVQYLSFEPTTPERITLEVLTEIMDRENQDNGLQYLPDAS